MIIGVSPSGTASSLWPATFESRRTCRASPAAPVPRMGFLFATRGLRKWWLLLYQVAEDVTAVRLVQEAGVPAGLLGNIVERGFLL